MGLRMYKKIQGGYHPSGRFYNKRQKKINIWPFVKLTFRQQRQFRRNERLYSSELKNSTFLRPLIQQKSSPVLNVKTKGGLQVFLKNTNLSSSQYIEDGLFYNQKSENNQNKLSESSRLQMVNANFLKTWISQQSDWRRHSLSFSLPSLRMHITNPLWYLQNPAPVPGILRIRKKNLLFGRESNSLHNLSLWLSLVSQKRLIRWLQQSKVYNGTSVNHPQVDYLWAFVQHLESKWPILLLKAGMGHSIVNTYRMFKQGKVETNGLKPSYALTSALPGDVVHINSIHYNDWLSSGIAKKCFV